jgi:RHS repeat-associated protein
MQDVRTLGNLLTLTTPGNNATTSNGVDAGITTTYNYTTDGNDSQSEALGEPIAITDNLGNTTHLRYSNRGQVASAIDALGNETDATYYLSGQTQQVELPATGQSGTGRASASYTYLYSGGPLQTESLSDEGNFGLIRSYSPSYGKEGELLSVSGNLNGYSLTYDALYRPVTLTDARNNPTTWLYDASGVLDKVTYPSGDFVEALTWDHNDQPLTAQNGRGQPFSYAYGDNESRLTQVLSADVDNAYTYDAYGRLQSLNDAPGVRSFTYDDDDLLVSQALTYTALPFNSTFNQGYGYNDDGSRSSLTLSNQAGTYNGSFTYSYNARGDLTGLVNPTGETYGWSYLGNGWLHTQQSGNAATTTYTYNAVGELLDLTNAHGSTLLSDFNLTGAGHYDGAGNLLGLTANLPAAPASYSGTSLYQYDSKDQLTDEQTPHFGTSGFAYDAAGNPTTFKTATGQTFSADNQNTAIGYDLDGNPMSWGTNALSFDTASHLTSVGTELTAGYNADGLRAWKQSSAGTTYFVYDGLTPIAEANSSGTVTAVNTWGANGLASRRSVSSGSSTFYTFDVQGSTAQRLDLNGNVLGSYCFDAYGTRYSTDNSSDPYTGFGAQHSYYRDAETGLSLLGHRYYDPGQGRFLNRDPIGYGGGLNLYAYTRNRPLQFIDPNGTQEDEGEEGTAGEGYGGVSGRSSLEPLPEAIDPAGRAAAYDGGGFDRKCPDLPLSAQADAPSPEQNLPQGPIVRLFRAVEPPELADLQRYGDYNIDPNSTFKRFYFNEAQVGRCGLSRNLEMFLAHVAFNVESCIM